LDYTQAKKWSVQRQFRVKLDEKVDTFGKADWNLTETALKETAVEVFPTLRAPRLDTWLTATATAELGSLIKQSSECRRLLSQARGSPDTVAQLRDKRKGLKKAIRICVEKHKRVYRRQLVVVATTSKDIHLRRRAWRQLAKGDDMSSDVPKSKQDVSPEAFKDHFENLFGKESLGETLGLTATLVGPKSAPNMELSGPPTLFEVQFAIGRLRDGTAPGANGLRPEIFKAGGDILAHQLQQDFGVIWPKSPRLDSSPEPDRRTGDTGRSENPHISSEGAGSSNETSHISAEQGSSTTDRDNANTGREESTHISAEGASNPNETSHISAERGSSTVGAAATQVGRGENPREGASNPHEIPHISAEWDSSTAERVKVFQTWQDAEVVTLFKGKGARTDPSNYRGIFLLDVAGKVLATVIERRLKRAAECWLDDSQNGFREKRSTSMSIHVLRRIQEACRSADLKAFAVFVDFEKAFDSPPRKALYECLSWIGIPSDLLAMVMAIHECPRGKVRGSSVWFKVARGVRQGCVLGPTMFIILLEFCKRMAGLNDLGIRLKCVDKKQLRLPADLSEVAFRVGSGEYADDMALVDTSPASLSAALSRLQSVCGRLGLNISVGKTEWIYLHNPDAASLGECRSKRTQLTHCCERIQLDGKPLKHVSCFKYLGSILSENGGVEEDTRYRVLQAQVSLNKYNAIWKSDLKLRQKVRFLKSHVFPSLVYAAECGNHTQLELGLLDVFINECRRRLLQVGRLAADGTVITNEELSRRCKLPSPLDLLSRRRIKFITKLIVQPTCMTARRMLFAEIDNQQGVGRRRVGGRERSSFLNVLALDVKYLYSGTPAGKSLDDLIVDAHCLGLWRHNRVLMALKPDTTRGRSLKLVSAREKHITCPVPGCVAKFAEQKECNRHVRKSHASMTESQVVPSTTVQTASGNESGERRPIRGVISTLDGTAGQNAGGGGLHQCTVPGCSRSYKTPGWLARHLKSSHGLAVPNDPITPPSAVIADVGLPIGGTASAVILAGQSPSVVTLNIPVSSSGDGGSGRIGVRRSRRTGGQGGCI
jgi:hypothetical protein